VVGLSLLSAAAARDQAPVAGRSAAAGNDPQPSSDDIRALDNQVQVILAEARRQQELLATQRERLERAEAANAWLPWLAAGLLALAGLAGWLGLRLWRLQRTRASAPVQAAAEPAPSAELTSVDMAALVAAAMPDSVPAQLPRRPYPAAPGNTSAAEPAPAPAPAPSRAPNIPPAQTTAVPPRLTPLQRDRSGMPLSTRDFSMGTHVPPRPVSVEELLDLDQQVDFFLALGQAQSAIDLLLSHVRGSGGTSALPYFKLLEIYRAQGDEEAYERTRERFNQRFNAHAPDWSGALADGRVLEDYPEVMQRLQRAWPQPIRAVAEMEGLLLRRADLEPFDLPAYRDLLMLHALVRDLPTASVSALSTTPAVLNVDPAPVPAAMPGDAVDLLLPLGEEPLDITAPRPHVADASSAQTLLADWVFTRAVQARRAAGAGDGPAPQAQPGIKLDLDLSDYAPAPREFTRPAAFTDIDMRRDKRLSDLGGLDEFDSDPTPLPSRR
jgi:pilus assembly protein FimV